MASIVIRTGKLTDKELIGVLDQLFKWFPAGRARISLPLQASLVAENADELKPLRVKGATRNVISFDFEFPEHVLEVVAFHRGVVDSERWKANRNTAGFNPPLPSGAFDEFAFLEPHHIPSGQPRNRLQTDTILAIHELLQKHAVAIDASSDDEATRLSNVVSRQVDDLRKLHLEMAEGLARAQANSEAEFAKRQTALEESFAKRVATLSDQEAELEKRRQELNDREPQHERRRLRESLTKDLQQFVKEPPAKAVQREWISNAAYIAVGFFFIGVSVFLTIGYGQLDATSTAFQWSTILKSTAAGIAGAAFMWAGLAGLKQTARSAREFEQQVQRYAFDMDRASWVVETILQMSASEKTQVPDEWLQAVCRDLFLSSGERHEEARSLEAFAALFDATAKARIGTSGVEFEIDRKGAKRLAHEANQ